MKLIKHMIKRFKKKDKTFEMLIETQSSLLIYDFKGKIIAKYRDKLEENGYKVTYVNLNNHYETENVVNFLPIYNLYDKKQAIFIIFNNLFDPEVMKLNRFIQRRLNGISSPLKVILSGCTVDIMAV